MTGPVPAPVPSLADYARQLVSTYDQMRPALPFRSDWIRMAAEVLREVARGADVTNSDPDGAR